MEITQEQKLLQQVVNEAWNNADFKKSLIENPLEAIEALTGEKLNIPEGKTFVVRDQTDESTVYINIPAPTMKDDVELNEEQLEAVAGGKGLIYYDNPFDNLGLGAGGPKPIEDIIRGGNSTI
jgi:hypothetical protein